MNEFRTTCRYCEYRVINDDGDEDSVCTRYNERPCYDHERCKQYEPKEGVRE